MSHTILDASYRNQQERTHGRIRGTGYIVVNEVSKVLIAMVPGASSSAGIAGVSIQYTPPKTLARDDASGGN
jgi:hypothetical protein